MKRLKELGKYLDLSEYEISEHFRLYELGNYDFSENLDFDNKEGVYFFTRREMTSKLSPSYQRQIYHHIPLYCGRTENFNKRFNDHFKKDDLKKAHCDHISICICDSKDEAVELEKKILSLVKTEFNEVGNENPKYKDKEKNKFVEIS